MEEKQATKISLSTFLLIIAIIAIIIMGVFIYKLNNDKTKEMQKSENLHSQVNSLNGTVSDLQGKISNISSTINSNSVTENQTETEQVKKNETNQTNQTKTYLYSTVKGSYKGTAKNNEVNVDGEYWLFLYENGTFRYENATPFASGEIGNYTIVGDAIILNYWFNTGSDAGLTATEGTKTLKINADNSITDSKPHNSNSSDLTMKKISSDENKENENNVNFLINNYYISNKTNS